MMKRRQQNLFDFQTWSGFRLSSKKRKENESSVNESEAEYHHEAVYHHEAYLHSATAIYLHSATATNCESKSFSGFGIQ